MASRGAQTGGISLAVLGGVAALVGTVLASGSFDDRSPGSPDSKDRPTATIGVIMMLAGGAAIAAGCAIALSHKTRLTIQTAPVARAPSVRLGRDFELSAEGLRF